MGDVREWLAGLTRGDAVRVLRGDGTMSAGKFHAWVGWAEVLLKINGLPFLAHPDDVFPANTHSNSPCHAEEDDGASHAPCDGPCDCEGGDNEIVEGDVVELASGGPDMTVTSIDAGRALCIWFDAGNHLCGITLPVSALVPSRCC